MILIMHRHNTRVITYINVNGQKIELVRYFAPNKIKPVITQKTYLHPTDDGTNIKWTQGQQYNILVRHSKIHHNLSHKLDKKLSHNQNKQLDCILKWIFKSKSTSNNKIKCSYKEISNALNIDCSSVNKIFNILQNINLIKVHGNNIFINPLWTYTCINNGGYNQVLNAFDDYYFSSQEWWKHMTTNDEFTINNKFKFN